MTDPTLVVRRVSGVDLRATVELLVHQQRARGNELSADQLRPSVQAALEDSDRVLVIGAFHEGLPGFQHGKMVAVLVMNVVNSIEHAGEVGWIEELYVRDDYRGRSLARSLLDRALGWAEGRGLRALELVVVEGYEFEEAGRLYDSRGFARVQRVHLSKALGPR